MNFSTKDKNPASEAFDKTQRRHAPFIIVFIALVGVLLSGAPWTALPLAFAIAAIYVGLFVLGAGSLRNVGLKLIDRLRGR